MNRFLSLFLLIFACLLSESFNAQNKQGHPMTPFLRKAGQSKIIDKSMITAYYAFNADKLDDSDTYIDYQKLQIGKNIIKYCSEWICQAEINQDKFISEHPHAVNVPSFLKFNKSNYWNEYQYSDYFIHAGGITVYTAMPFGAREYNCFYQETYPLMHWTLCNENKSILGYECQKATCNFRGRNYVAWFAPTIPAKYGPWKFGGLPGLILKVSDTQNIYTFECVKLTKQPQDITRKPFTDYRKRERMSILKLVRKLNENYYQAVGMHAIPDNQGKSIIPQKANYEPLEME